MGLVVTGVSCHSLVYRRMAKFSRLSPRPLKVGTMMCSFDREVERPPFDIGKFSRNGRKIASYIK